MRIAIILGTRPEIIKLSSIIKECHQRNLDYFIIHSNQHYSHNMDTVFFEDLKLSLPKYNLNIGSGTHGNQTGRMLIQIEEILIKECPDVVLVQGDTNTVLSAALAATKLNIKIGHVEAGLRSYNRKMPEETNRIVTDHISSYLFCPTNKQKEILTSEGIEQEKLFVVGNTIVDAVVSNTELAEQKSEILGKIGMKNKDYFLLTLHRALNVDFKDNLVKLCQNLSLIAKEFDIPIIYPVHPRTKKMLELFNLHMENVTLIEPQPYLDFLMLEKNAQLILTDSGGVQEEACILKIPCVTLRNDTERPETVEVGSNILTGIDANRIISAIKTLLSSEKNWQNPFGEGISGKRILDIITSIKT